MPDEVERSAIGVDDGRPRVIDTLDNAYEFELAFSREPRSWADYCYGMAHLARARARVSLQDAGAFRASQTVEDAWKEWLRDTRHNAGWD